MAVLNRSGQVQNLEQIRADRQRKGLCKTCRIDPVQCYQIKKRFGGLTREKIPLTQPGRVFNGICLDCNPNQDPDGPRTHDKNIAGKSAAAKKQEDGYTRAHSLPAYTKHPSPRTSGTKILAMSISLPVPADLQNLQEDSMNYLDLHNDGIEHEDDHELSGLTVNGKQFDPNASGGSVEVESEEALDALAQSCAQHMKKSTNYLDLHNDGIEHEDDHEVSGLTVTGKQFDPNASGGSLESEEPLDALAQLCAQHSFKTNQSIKFDPASKTVLPNTELQLQEIGDDATVLSGLTLDTFFQGRNSIATKATRRQSSRRDILSLDAINEASSPKS